MSPRAMVSRVVERRSRFRLLCQECRATNWILHWQTEMAIAECLVPRGYDHSECMGLNPKPVAVC